MSCLTVQTFAFLPALLAVTPEPVAELCVLMDSGTALMMLSAEEDEAALSVRYRPSSHAPVDVMTFDVGVATEPTAIFPPVV